MQNEVYIVAQLYHCETHNLVVMNILSFCGRFHCVPADNLTNTAEVTMRDSERDGISKQTVIANKMFEMSKTAILNIVESIQRDKRRLTHGALSFFVHDITCLASLISQVFCKFLFRQENFLNFLSLLEIFSTHAFSQMHQI